MNYHPAFPTSADEAVEVAADAHVEDMAAARGEIIMLADRLREALIEYVRQGGAAFPVMRKRPAYGRHIDTGEDVLLGYQDKRATADPEELLAALNEMEGAFNDQQAETDDFNAFMEDDAAVEAAREGRS